MQIFSLPINPKLNQNQFNYFISWIKNHKDYIYDLYFTCRISPFDQDAMGDTFVSPESTNQILIETALDIQRHTGVKVSATFNNIHVRPDQENLDTFIKNFKPLYEQGIRSITIPHTSWVLTNQLQTEFPELFIKNTILRKVNTANQVYELAKSGFNYVNLDRDLMRNRDELLKIKKVKEKFPKLKVSLLANEGCIGNCPIMPEHYQFNCTRSGASPQYFNSSIARISCQKWDMQENAVSLKTANLPPWREDWEELRSIGIDTFKMHGRESITRLFESMKIIENYKNNKEILFDTFNDYIDSNNLKNKPIDAWRKIIKNCKFDCWDCNFCDKIYEAKSINNANEYISKVVDIIAFSNNNDLKNTDIQGLTSHRVRQILFEFGKISNSYLEVGSFLGSTGSAILESNIKNAFFVDKWQDNIQPASGESLPENNKDAFIKNLKKYKKDTNIQIFNCDLFEADKKYIKDVDLFFYDGPHDEYTTAQAIKYYASCLSDKAIIIFDDANWDGVVSGAKKGIAQANLKTIYEKILLNEQESSSQWWNGLYITVIEK